MKVRHITTAIVFASVAALAGPASATTSSGNLQQDIRRALHGGANVSATLQGNTVTLIGYASALDKVNAGRAASAFPNVDRVINLVSEQS